MARADIEASAIGSACPKGQRATKGSAVIKSNTIKQRVVLFLGAAAMLSGAAATATFTAVPALAGTGVQAASVHVPEVSECGDPSSHICRL
jgi:hypothetical protein